MNESISAMLATIRRVDPATADRLGDEAQKVLGFDPSRPDAYAANGEPLWHMDPEALARKHGRPVAEIEAKLAELEAAHGRMVPDPRVAVVQSAPLPPLGVWPTGRFDEDGEEVFLLNAETTALLMLERAHDDATGADPFPKATGWLNAWCSLARQRGASDMTLRRLREAIKAPEFDPGRVRLVARRVAKHASFEELVRDIVGLPMTEAPDAG